jgi:hypothetical protein
MGKWIGGLAATVIGGVLVFWLTVGIQPSSQPSSQPPSQPPTSTPKTPSDLLNQKAERIVGYLVVFRGSSIQKAEDLRRDDKICTSKRGAQLARTLGSLSAANLIVVAPAEWYMLLERNACTAVFVIERETADKLFPVGTTAVSIVAVYGP